MGKNIKIFDIYTEKDKPDFIATAYNLKFKDLKECLEFMKKRVINLKGKLIKLSK